MCYYPLPTTYYLLPTTFFLMHLYIFFDTCLHRHVVSIPVATRETLFVCACGHICHSHELFRRDATRLIPALWAEEAPFEIVSTQANIDHKCKQEHKRNRSRRGSEHLSHKGRVPKHALRDTVLLPLQSPDVWHVDCTPAGQRGWK